MDPLDKRQPDRSKKLGVKRYSKPRLDVYGGLSELTAVNGKSGAFDKPPPRSSTNKTGV